MIQAEFPSRKTYSLLAGAALFLFSIATWGAALPEFYGVYAVSQGGTFYEFPKAPENATSGMHADSIKLEGLPVMGLEKDKIVKILLFDRSVAHRAPEVQIQKLVYTKTNKWQLRDINQGIDIRLQPVKNQPDMVYLVPRHPLEDGVYMILIGDWGSAKFLGCFFVGEFPAVWDEQSKTWKRN